MKLKTLLISSLLVTALSTPVMAKEDMNKELGSPVVALMPAFEAIRAELKLDDKQSKVVDAWLAEAPAKRTDLKKKILAVRAELREALITRDTRVKRDALKKELNEANNRLIELSSLCIRMLHTTMTKEQYAKIVEQSKKST